MSVAVWSRVIQDAVEQYSPTADPAGEQYRDGRWFEQSFRDLSRIYESYWRDDPEFDNTNTRQAAPHLPCPEMDYDALMRMARYAIQTNFGKIRPMPHARKLDVHQRLRTLHPADGPADPDASSVSGVGSE